MIKPDFIGSDVLVSSKQLAPHIEALHTRLATAGWVSTERIMQELAITPSRSAATMVGHAVRNDGMARSKRTMHGRLYLFGPYPTPLGA